jgi:hypothetical protein
MHLMAVDIDLKNELRVRRVRDWLCRGVPFPQGALTDVAALRLRNEAGDVVPLAAEKSACWPDGSVQWALVQFPISFESSGSRTWSLDWTGDADPVDDVAAIRLTRSESRWEVDNGRVRFELPLTGKALLASLGRVDQPLLSEVRAEIQDASGARYIGELTSEPVIEHSTDLMLVVRRQGVHRDVDGMKLFSFVFRVTVFADADDIEIEYQFVHDEPFREVPEKPQVVQGIGSPSIDTDHPGMRGLRAVRLRLLHEIGSATEYATCPFRTVGNQGLIAHARPLRVMLTEGVRTGLYDFMIDGDVLAADEPVGRSHGWISVGDGAKGLAVSVRKFAQQWPKGLEANDRAIVIDLWPEAGGMLHVFQGQAKSHQVKLRPFSGAAADARLADWHFAYQFPVVLSAPDWFIDSGAIGPVFRYQPKKYPGIERKYHLEFEQFLAYGRCLGMMDYADYEQLVSASWGRRGSFMSNLEHDLAQSVWLQFVRTGGYRYADYFEAAVRHVLDVDIVHFDDRGDHAGAWREHGSFHASPHGGHLCHMWTESLVSSYFHTGHVPALAAARGVADWIARRVERGEGRTGARERGWPLIALSAVYRATGDQRYAQAATTIVDSFVEGPDPVQADGGLSGGWGPMPYQQAVMGSVAATGLACYHRIFGDDRSRGLLLRICDWLCSDAVRSPEGLYLSMPGNNTSMSYVAHSNFRESFGYAWELTGDQKYLEAGLRDLSENMASTVPASSIVTTLTAKDGHEVVVSTGDRMSIFWRENLRFMDHADRAGLLSDF